MSNFFDSDIANAISQQARAAVQGDLQRLAAANQQLAHRVAREEARSIWDTLDQQLPNWREINSSSEFLQWLSTPDEMAGPGASKATWLRQAFGAGDASRVLSIFRAYVAEAGYGARQQQSSRRQAEPAFITNKDLDRHYQRAARGEYPDEATKNAAEAKLMQAVNSGRFRRV